MTILHDGNNTVLRNFRSIKVYVNVRRLRELMASFVREQLVVSAMLEFGLCVQSVECSQPKTRSVRLTNGPTIVFIRHYGDQQSASTTKGKFSKRKGLVPFKIHLTQLVQTEPFSQIMFMDQTEQKSLAIATLRHQTGNGMECSGAQELQCVERTIPFCNIVANITREMKVIFINQVVAIADWRPNHVGCKKKWQETCYPAPELAILRKRTTKSSWELSSYMPRSSFEKHKRNINDPLIYVFAMQRTSGHPWLWCLSK